MILLQIDMGNWLLQQAPVIVVMGIAIWWLVRQLAKKDKQLLQVSKSAIELATKYETKCEYLSGKNKESHQEIMTLLKEKSNKTS